MFIENPYSTGYMLPLSFAETSFAVGKVLKAAGATADVNIL